MAKQTNRYIELQLFKKGQEPMIPNIKDGIEVRLSRDNPIGTMEFSVLKDSIINFHEGDQVVLYLEQINKNPVNRNKPFFVGYVFEKGHTRNKTILTTAYDQLRYLKNKDTYKIEGGKTYSQLLKDIIEERNLISGEIAETEHILADKIEENAEYLEMLSNAETETRIAEDKMYILMDIGGKIYLKALEDLKLDDYVITREFMEGYEYQSSIDSGVYNRIKIVTESGEIVEDAKGTGRDTSKNWGILQYTAKDNTSIDLNTKVKEVLNRVNRKQRTLKLTGVYGHIGVRPGTLLQIYMPALGDLDLITYMMVDTVVHKFRDGSHLMDLELLNQDFLPAVDLSGTFVWKEPELEATEEVGSTETIGETSMAGGVPGDSIQVKVWNYFRQHGYSQAATAGVMGNIQQECGFNPTLVEAVPKAYGTRGYGLIQWTGSRRTAIENWAAQNGKDLADVYTQLEYFIWEFESGTGGVPPVGIEGYKNIDKDHKYATDQLHDYYIRSDDKNSNWDGMLNRYNSAKRFYEEFSAQEQPRMQASGIQQQLVQTAFKYKGIYYVWGGTTPNGFDCSGFVQYVYAECGISIPRVTTSQEYAGIDVTGQTLEPGDLVFWGTRGATYHVGMYIGDGKYIHSPQTGDYIREATLGNYSVVRRIV